MDVNGAVTKLNEAIARGNALAWSIGASGDVFWVEATLDEFRARRAEPVKLLESAQFDVPADMAVGVLKELWETRARRLQEEPNEAELAVELNEATNELEQLQEQNEDLRHRVAELEELRQHVFVHERLRRQRDLAEKELKGAREEMLEAAGCPER